MDTRFDSFVLRIMLDTVVPLENEFYQINREGKATLVLSVDNTFARKERIGSFEVHGDVRVHHTNGAGCATLEMEYGCASPLTPEEFAEYMSISPVWHMSASGWDFVLADLNRVIDLYRHFANAYWWQHISMWNVDELHIYGRGGTGGALSFISQSSSPKPISFDGKSFDDVAHDGGSSYIFHVKNGTKLPLYFVMYLNGRRSFVEHAYREALISWANCVEAYSWYFLSGACNRAGLSSVETDTVFESAGEFRSRFSKIYEILARAKIFPSSRKKQAIKWVDSVMEHRNAVMHGRDPKLDWMTLGKKQDDLNQLLNIAYELGI